MQIRQLHAKYGAKLLKVWDEGTWPKRKLVGEGGTSAKRPPTTSSNSPEGSKNQEFPVFLLSVRIIKANILTSRDALTSSDCYVTLYLPTSSLEKFRTQAIKDSANPVWNETFYFRIQTKIKNILELEVCDADPVTKDNIQFTIAFDLEKVWPGATILEIFSLKPESDACHYSNDDSLEVEFRLSELPGPVEHFVSNCVLAARELSILNVKVDKELNEKLLKAKKNVVLTVQESYEGTQKTTKDLNSFCFHCIKIWGPVLKVKLQNISCKEENDSGYSLVLPLKFLPEGQEVNIDLPVKEASVASFNQFSPLMDTWSSQGPQDLDVRLGYELCAEEQDFLQKRKRVVADALKKLFDLRLDLLEDEVPVVAVMATGGGCRAMAALYGHLLGLQKLNILDCVSYITTSSGSTWTMTNLYQNPDWSHKSLDEPIKAVKRQMLKSKWDIISIERLKYYHKELVERAEMGHIPSFTCLWALVQEGVLHDGANKNKLSEQRAALNRGQNPLPIYTVINVKEKLVSTFDFREWVEFSPYEVGFLKYGTSIRTEDFDSQFFMGKIVKKLPESRICFLEGIWTNIFSPNLLDGLYWSSSPEEFWERWVKDMVESEDNNSYDGYTIYKPPSGAGKFCKIFNDILTDRPLKEGTHNFLRSLDFCNNYLEQKDFIYWRDTVLDTSPYKLTPTEKSLCLIDIGFFVNNSGPPLLKPERNVDVIIALDYDMSEVFKQIEMMAKYCEVQGIPFPKVDPTEEDRKNPKECYVFSDDDNPKAPILVYFPLVNCTFKEYIAPGVKRTPSQMSGGEVNVGPHESPYKTLNLTYSSENFDRLLNLSTYNILFSKDRILQSIQRAMQKRLNIRPRNLNTSSV
ncbi:cytosolic phospholipase A2 beta-like [Hemicordylus capensis]|uniref:cytosolic phospholipase A2 beta-like n=1 Tax=Hemicordylus capensis TaxID=884348 RepID=UPI0023024111|nr:cytosolic phospholipase A2 beta-like [Hemicordylus capensis]